MMKKNVNAVKEIRELNGSIEYNARDIADAHAEIECIIQMIRAKMHDLPTVRRENIENAINEIAEMNDKIDAAVVEIWQLTIIIYSAFSASDVEV